MELIFTDEATEMLISVALFIEEKWNLKQAEKFLAQAYKTFDLLLEHPYIFKASTLDQNIRIGYIAKQCSFFYEIKKPISLFSFFGTIDKTRFYNIDYCLAIKIQKKSFCFLLSLLCFTLKTDEI